MKEYFLNIWIGLSTVAIGMKVTFKHLFVLAVTIQYPNVRVELPERERNRLYVNMDDCIGCDQCSRACPVNCIEIETVKSLPTEDLGKTSNGKKKALWVTKFDIDLAKCCYCQLCVFPCPTECIYMTNVFEFSEFERKDFIYDYVTLTTEERKQKKLNYQKFEAEKATEKAAKKPVITESATETKNVVKENIEPKVQNPPASSENSQQNNLKEPGENKVS